MAGYGTDASLATYLAETGRVLPASATAAAVRATGSAYIDSTYGSRFTGEPTDGISQEREWPRTGASAYGTALASNLIPQRVVTASYEAAWIEAQKPGSLSRTYTPGEQKVLTEVKGIKWEVVGDASKEGAMRPISTTIEGMLAPLLVPEAMPAILVV